MKQLYPTNFTFTFRSLPLYRNTSLFLLIFLLNFTLGFGQGVTISSGESNPTQNNPIEISIEFNERINGFEESDVNVNDGNLSNFQVEWPEFEFTNVSERLNDFEVTIDFSGETDFSTASNSVIAIDIDNDGFIYALTLDEGVFKYNPSGSLVSNNPIVDANELNEPRDLAVDDNANIFIANSGSNQVLKFDSNGGNREVINSGLSSPSGLAISLDQKIYVADTDNDRVVIFNNAGSFAGEIDNGSGVGTEQLFQPVRLAVDNSYNVYVTDAGNNRIQIYNSDGNHINTIDGNTEDLRNPGSLVVDDYGFLYVADFEGVSLNTFLNFEDIEPLEAVELIFADHRIQVFRTEDLNLGPETIDYALNVPVDLALKPCGFLAVNNSDADGENFPTIKFIFDFKTYEILPTKFTAALEINEECIPAQVSIDGEVGRDANCNSISASDEFSRIWDQTKPEVQTCYQENQTVELEDEIPDYVEEGLVVFEDNCEGTLEYDQTPTPGTEISQQTTTVSITATDEAGNVSDECTFDLVVEEEELFIDCPDDQTEDFQGECEFELPDYTDDADVTSGANVSQSPVAGTFITENTEITLTAELDGETKKCTFNVEATNQPPALAISCPGDQTEDADANDIFEIPDYTNLANVANSCGNINVTQSPVSGTEIDENTTIILSAVDDRGVSVDCSFEVILNFQEELFIDCPGTQTEDFQGECEFELPDYTDDADVTSGANVSQSPVAGTFITENTEITLTAELDGETRQCTFNVEATNQRPALAISCPGDQTEDANANDTFEISDYTNLANVANSCGNINVTQSPVSGTEIDENTTIILSAVDDRGVSVDCSFEVILNFQEELFIDCPGTQTEDFQGECEFELPDYTDDADVTSGANVSQSPVAGTFITENTEITLTAELDGETRQCTFNVEATNRRPDLAISCSGDQTETADANEVFEIPDYTNLANLANSCGNINVTQSPVAGTVVDENTTIILSAVDDREVSVDCNFEVILNFTDPSAPEIECINQEIFLDEDGQAILDVNKVYNGERDDLELSLSQENFDCSNLGANTVTLTATDPVTGLSSNCSAGVEVIDSIFPEANCVAPGREFRLQNGSVTISPSAIDLNSEDNCEITRRLSEDTFTTPGIKNITLFVEDAAGNTDECATSIEVLAEDDQSAEPGYTCFEGDIPDLRLDENCEINVIPDYSYLVETENFTPRFEQTEERFGETLVVTLEVINAEDNNLVGECTFSINIVDLLPPNISCPGDQTENFDPETGFEVPNYESWATFSDNCGEVSFRQEPEAGAIIFQDTTVQLFAEDANEQVASCSFELQLTEANVLNIFCQIDQNVSPDEDCSFTLPDYTDTAEVSLPGATVAQSPPEGTVINENTQVKLTATLNGETDECFFMVNLVDNENPVANCVSGYVVNLDESGNATLAPEMLDNNSTDNCGIVSMALSQINFTRADIGEVPITLTVRDDAGNMDTCETTVEVVDENSGEFECRENVVVNLNENGEAVLSLQELYTGNASGLTLAASRLNFMCSDLGMVQIQLDYSGAQTGSCTINVEVRDEIPPFINTDIVELTLDDEGFAYLEEGDVLAENNCGQQFIYRFSKSVFNCEDVGVNTVNVEVEDASGNIAEKNIEVRVNGEACEIPDNEDLEFLFIYPNPNNGTFTIATPEGMQVEQVRVFDSRGRFILQKEYKDIARFYRMTIEGVESSVYTLQIFTNEGVVVKRVIISQ